MSMLAYPDPPELDHIIHLVPTGGLQDAVKQFQKLGFSVESGGVHADGLTQNALIVLTDGVYIELIEFLDKPLPAASSAESLQQWRERRSKHWWWGRQPGWVDWCLRGGVHDGCVEAINKASEQVKQSRTAEDSEKQQQAGTTSERTPADAEKPAAGQQRGRDGETSLRSLAPSWGRATEKNAVRELSDEEAESLSPHDLIRYQAGREGGRRALSGKEIKWKVTFPVGLRGIPRGAFPFWCEDVTPRWWRVPTPSPQHPNLTKGLAAITLLYYPETFPSRIASLQLVLSSRQTAQQGDGVGNVSANVVDTRPPPKTEGRTALPDTLVEFFLATPEGPLLPLRVKAAQDPNEEQWLKEHGEGLWEVEITVAPEKLPNSAPPDGIERETAGAGCYGRLRLHPMRAHIIPRSSSSQHAAGQQQQQPAVPGGGAANANGNANTNAGAHAASTAMETAPAST